MIWGIPVGIVVASGRARPCGSLDCGDLRFHGGVMDRGRIKIGEPVEIVGLQEKSQNSVVTGVEMFHKMMDEGQAGDNLGLLLRGIERTDVERGMVVAKPGSITPHT